MVVRFVFGWFFVGCFVVAVFGFVVDMFIFIADNISVTAMAREQKHPPV